MYSGQTTNASDNFTGFQEFGNQSNFGGNEAYQRTKITGQGSWGTSNQGAQNSTISSYLPLKIGYLLQEWKKDKSKIPVGIWGRTANIVKIVGLGIRKQTTDSRLILQVEDGTGIISVELPIPCDPSPFRQSQIASVVQSARYVKVYGELTVWGKDTVQVLAHAIRPLDTFDEVMFHELDVMATAVRCQSSQPSGQDNNDLKSGIMTVLLDSQKKNPHSHGTHINAIFENLQMRLGKGTEISIEKISRELTELDKENKVCTSINADHWRALE